MAFINRRYFGRKMEIERGGGVSLKTNLISYWKCEEPAASNFTDAHGSKTLTQQSSPTSEAGKIGSARGFNVASPLSQIAYRADDADFEPGSNPFFVTMWVKMATLSLSEYPSFISKFNTTGNQMEWALNFGDASDTPYLGVSSNGSGVTNSVASTTALSTSAWSFIAAGWDGTDLKISVNGETFITSAFSGTIFAGTARLELGSRDNGGKRIRATIDEVAFWKDRCLTQEEVAYVYNSGSGLGYDSWA